MLNWIREKLLKRPSVSSSLSVEETDNYSSKDSSIMHDEQSVPQPNDKDKLCLHIIFEGDIWVIDVDRQQIISDLINMAITHFMEPKESYRLNSRYKFISILQMRALNPQNTVGDEELQNNDEILLTARISTGATIPLKLTIQDIKGPTKEEILAATMHLKKLNSIQTVPGLDCQENFQSEIRKVLYTLVETSAKILSQSPDAKIIFESIAARVSARYKKEVDKNALQYLKDLGFTDSQARYALRLKRNRQIEAMEWLLENSERVKEESPECANVASTSAATSPTPDDPLSVINKLLEEIRDFNHKHFEPSPRALETLQGMGFDQDKAVEALRVAGNNQVAACEWLCGERDPTVTNSEGLDKDTPLYKALMDNPAIQLGLHNPKIMLAFLSILENPANANLWLNDVDAAPVLAQVFKTYHAEKHMMVVNQQVEMMRQQKRS